MQLESVFQLFSQATKSIDGNVDDYPVEVEQFVH